MKKIKFQIVLTVVEDGSNFMENNDFLGNTNFENSLISILDQKIRDKLQDYGLKIFLSSQDNMTTLFNKERKLIESHRELADGNFTHREFKNVACEEWIDVRGLGQVFEKTGVKVHGSISMNVVDFNVEPSIGSGRMNYISRHIFNKVSAKRSDVYVIVGSFGKPGRKNCLLSEDVVILKQILQDFKNERWLCPFKSVVKVEHVFCN